MRSVETIATITPEGILSVAVPSDLPAGQHRVVLLIDEQPVPSYPTGLADFPVDDLGPWPAHLSLRREELYDERGR